MESKLSKEMKTKSLYPSYYYSPFLLSGSTTVNAKQNFGDYEGAIK